MTVKRISLGRLSALPHGRAKLVIGADGRRYACVRRPRRDDVEDAVDVLDDRCPHEGHPLSMGLVRDGVLTCQWHNWKFDLASGGCTFGGEGVRRYEAEVWNDEVFVDPALDVPRAEQRFAAELAQALREGNIDAAVRVALRWTRIRDFGTVVEGVVRELAGTGPHGYGDAIAAIVALSTLEPFDEAERFAVIASVAAEELRGRAERTWPDPIASTLDEPESFLADLVEERRDDAVARVRGLLAAEAPLTVARRWILPFLSSKVWNRGDEVIRFAAATAFPLALPAAVESLAWATADSDLPPWRTTRNALLAARAIEAGTGEAPGDLPAALLGRESEAVLATMTALEAGTSPGAVLACVARTGVERLARYDVSWSTRIGSTATMLDAARPLVFARAVTTLVARGLTTASQEVALAVQAAALCGKLAMRDGPVREGGEPLAAVVRHELLRDDCTLSRRAIVLAALDAHARDHSEDLPRVLGAARALVEEPTSTLARVAGNAARHVATGEPPTDGD